MTALDQVWTTAARAVRPLPPPLSYVDFAHTVILPDGRGKGHPYYPASHPAQFAILQALDGGTYFAPTPYREVAIAKPVQDGGSLVTVVPLLRRVIQQRQSVLIAFPTLDSAKDVWTTKIIPILRAYGGQEPESGGGSRGGAARVVTLPNGGRFFLRAAGGRGESQQASVTGDALCVDEVDDWPDMHRLELIRHRVEEAADPLLLLVCTVKKANGSLILAAVAEGTNSRLHYACPACGTYQPMEWSSVTYERSEQACVGGSARYVCISCGVAHDEHGWREMLTKWRVVHHGQEVTGTGDAAVVTGPIPITPRFSLRWSRLESPRKNLQSLCSAHARAEWHLAHSDHGPMRSFVQDYLTQSYTGDQIAEDGAPARITRGYLVARSEQADHRLVHAERIEDGDSVYRSSLPDGVEWLVASVDVQRGGDRAPPRGYYLLTGMDSAFRTWDLAWGSHRFAGVGGQASESEMHAGLTTIDGILSQLAAEYERPLARRGIDVGDRQDEIRRWLMRHQGWWAIKGAAATKAKDQWDLPGWIYRHEQEGGWYLYRIESGTVRQQAQAQFLVTAGKPGSASLPKGVMLQDSIIRHYCGTALINDLRMGTRWSDRPKDREHHHEWQRRIDLLDCRTYNLAMGYQYLRQINTPRTTKKYGVVGRAFA